MYNGIKVLDIHSHVSAPFHGAQVAGLLMSQNTPKQIDPRTNSAEAFGFTDENWAKSHGGHMAQLKDHNIDAQLLGPRPIMMMGMMEQHLRPTWTRFTNHMIYKQVSLAPETFVGAAMLPQNPDAEDLSDCVPELDRCVEELDFKAVYLSPDPTGDRRSPGMDQKYWHPVYARCQHHGIPILVHGSACRDPRIRSLPQNYQIGFVWEQYLATQLLAHGDVFDRFPELKVVVCHCGGALDRFIKNDYHMPPKDRSKNLYFDTNALDLDFLEAAIKQRTPARMCFGTETPGSGRHIRPETGRPGDDLVPVIGGFDFISEDEKIMMFNDNPRLVCPGLGALDPKR